MLPFTSSLLRDVIADDVQVAWTARAIDNDGQIDIPVGRTHWQGPTTRRQQLSSVLDSLGPLDALCAELARDQITWFLDTDSYQMAAHRTGGYVYIAAWVKP